MRIAKLTSLMVLLAHVAVKAFAQTCSQWEVLCDAPLSNPDQLPELIHHAAVSGPFAYLAGDAAGLRVFNISNACPPFEVAHYSPRGFGRALDVAGWGSNALVAFEYGGVHVVELSNAHPPVLRQVLEGPGEPGAATSVATSGDLALLSAGLETVHLFALRRGGESVWLSTYLTGEPGSSYVQLVRVFGGLALCACSRLGTGNEVQIVDVSQPLAPVRLASVTTAAPCVGMVLHGPNLFLLDEMALLYGYSLTDPAHPQPTGTNAFFGVGTSVFADDAFVYVTASLSGFVILPNPPANTTAPLCLFPMNDARAIFAAGSRLGVADASAIHLFGARPTEYIPPLVIHSIYNPGLRLTNAPFGWAISFTNRALEGPRTYILQGTESLSPKGNRPGNPIVWLNLRTNRIITIGVTTMIDPATNTQRFYRVLETD